MHIKAYTILCGILFLAVATFSYLKWEEYSSAKVLIEESDSLVATLQNGVTQSSSNYFENKDQFDELQKSVETKLAAIFPSDEQYTDLTRQMDGFEEQLAKTKDPFEISHIDYQSPMQQDQYSILPLRMSIRSSNENFQKFLHLVENSGSLNERVRLMDISSIRLNFENTDENVATPEIINFTVQINAYFQNI